MIPNTITKRRTDGDRGVSPVIGVILMVAITVILAAVIGTFVLDLGNNAGKSAPSASLAVTTNINANNVTISHKGGDGLDSSQTRVVVKIGDKKQTFDPTSNSVVLSVGSEATINVTDGSGGSHIDWNGDGTYDYDVSTSNIASSPLASGTQVNIQLIDTDSQRVIYETTVTA